MNKITGRIYRYITNSNAPLYNNDARFAVRSNEELQINELLFDAPMFFSFLRETGQIENYATDDDCVISIAKGIAQYFVTKVHRIEKHGSLKKVFFINIISWYQRRDKIFSYLVSGEGKFSDFEQQVNEDHPTPEDIYKKLEEEFFDNDTDNFYYFNLQTQFNVFSEDHPVEVFFELAFLSYFINSYCEYLFGLMDSEIMPKSLTEEESEKFMGMLTKIVNLEFNKAFSYFEKEYLPSCLGELEKYKV